MRPAIAGCIVLLLVTAVAPGQTTPADGAIQFRFDIPPGRYEMVQAHVSDRVQQTGGPEMRDYAEMTVTWNLTAWPRTPDGVQIVLLDPKRIQASVNRMGMRAAYDSAGPADRQDHDLAELLAPLLEKPGGLRSEGDAGYRAVGIADDFPVTSGMASMPLGMMFSSEAMTFLVGEMFLVVPERPKAEGARWRSRTNAWAMRSKQEKGKPQIVTFERVQRTPGGRMAVLSFVSEMPPLPPTPATPSARLTKTEGEHAGQLLYDLDRHVVREYTDTTHWAYEFAVGAAGGQSMSLVSSNRFDIHVTITPVSSDPGPMPPELLGSPEPGEELEEEHAED